MNYVLKLIGQFDVYRSNMVSYTLGLPGWKLILWCMSVVSVTPIIFIINLYYDEFKYLATVLLGISIIIHILYFLSDCKSNKTTYK